MAPIPGHLLTITFENFYYGYNPFFKSNQNRTTEVGFMVSSDF